MNTPKPITVIFPDGGGYADALERLRRKVEETNLDGRVVSRAHLVRYAIRVAAETPLDKGAAQQVLTRESIRGRQARK